MERLKEKKEEKISRGERRGLTGCCDQAPWRAPSPFAQTFKKTYPPLSDLGDRRRLHLRLPGPKSSPLCPQSLSKRCLSLGEGNGTPLQYCCLENPMDEGSWWAAVHGVAGNQTRLSDFTFTFHFHALEKEMATHSSVLAWKIPWMEKPGRLQSMGSHRVGHTEAT